jgi:hypothetical protein
VNDRVSPYIDELKGDASHAAYASELQHHFDDQLTHDGKAKPRKEDVFKKIKNWFKGK